MIVHFLIRIGLNYENAAIWNTFPEICEHIRNKDVRCRQVIKTIRPIVKKLSECAVMLPHIQGCVESIAYAMNERFVVLSKTLEFMKAKANDFFHNLGHDDEFFIHSSSSVPSSEYDLNSQITDLIQNIYRLSIFMASTTVRWFSNTQPDRFDIDQAFSDELSCNIEKDDLDVIVKFYENVGYNVDNMHAASCGDILFGHVEPCDVSSYCTRFNEQASKNFQPSLAEPYPPLMLSSLKHVTPPSPVSPTSEKNSIPLTQITEPGALVYQPPETVLVLAEIELPEFALRWIEWCTNLLKNSPQQVSANGVYDSEQRSENRISEWIFHASALALESLDFIDSCPTQSLDKYSNGDHQRLVRAVGGSIVHILNCIQSKSSIRQKYQETFVLGSGRRSQYAESSAAKFSKDKISIPEETLSVPPEQSSESEKYMAECRNIRQFKCPNILPSMTADTESTPSHSSEINKSSTSLFVSPCNEICECFGDIEDYFNPSKISHMPLTSEHKVMGKHDGKSSQSMMDYSYVNRFNQGQLEKLEMDRGKLGESMKLKGNIIDHMMERGLPDYSVFSSNVLSYTASCFKFFHIRCECRSFKTNIQMAVWAAFRKGCKWGCIHWSKFGDGRSDGYKRIEYSRYNERKSGNNQERDGDVSDCATPKYRGVLWRRNLSRENFIVSVKPISLFENKKKH